jgi:hypothetical protein
MMRPPSDQAPFPRPDGPQDLAGALQQLGNSRPATEAWVTYRRTPTEDDRHKLDAVRDPARVAGRRHVLDLDHFSAGDIGHVMYTANGMCEYLVPTLVVF